jgi:hypothetical protein
VNSGFLHSAHAVERPKAPLPTMMIDLGTLGVGDEDVAADIAQRYTQNIHKQQRTRRSTRSVQVTQIHSWG